MQTLRQQAASFAVIGGIGFIIDGGILTMLNSQFGVDLLRARLVSFAVAVTATWSLNRRNTFAQRKSPDAAGEWGRYALVNGIGALLNLGIFFWLIDVYARLAEWPIVPLAIAASVALLFNFFASRYLVFRPAKS